MLRLRQYKQVLAHTVDEFTTLVTDGDLSASIPDQNIYSVHGTNKVLHDGAVKKTSLPVHCTSSCRGRKQPLSLSCLGVPPPLATLKSRVTMYLLPLGVSGSGPIRSIPTCIKGIVQKPTG